MPSFFTQFKAINKLKRGSTDELGSRHLSRNLDTNSNFLEAVSVSRKTGLDRTNLPQRSVEENKWSYFLLHCFSFSYRILLINLFVQLSLYLGKSQKESKNVMNKKFFVEFFFEIF